MAAGAHGQDALFSNASTPSVPALATTSLSGDTTPAPDNAAWSEVQALGVFTANAAAGFAAHAGTDDAWRVADDFVVDRSQGWRLSEAVWYVYSPDWVSEAPPVSGANLLIRSGSPAEGAPLVFGAAATIQPVMATATNIYRVFTTMAGPTVTPPDTSRRIWRVTVGVDVALAQGTYWVDCQFVPAVGAESVYVVPATLEGALAAPGANALQARSGGWTWLADPGKPVDAPDTVQDLAFELWGLAGAGCDSLDFNRDGVFPDTQDIFALLTVFSGGACPNPACADLDFNNDGVYPDTSDLTMFLYVFTGGMCP